VNDNEFFVLVLDTKTTAKTEQIVKQRIDDCQCLACETEGKLRRGLCTKCYTRWNRARASMPTKDSCQFDARLIRKGLLLSAQQTRRIKTDCIFERLRK
jgi:hypothetical protein